MKTEFLAVCSPELKDYDIKADIEYCLTAALEEHFESWGYESLALSPNEPREMISVSLKRTIKDESENIVRSVFGFSVEFGIDAEALTTRQLQDVISYLEKIIERFGALFVDDDVIIHLVKFYDDVLLESHLAKMREVHEIEMKLRQALSLIYLSACEDEDFYNLLRKEKVETQKSKPKNTDAMKGICENEFFHLVFGQYPRLNNKKDLKSHNELVEVLIRAPNFEQLKSTLLSNPITNEDDADLIKALSETAPRIEDFRNCVAHNRKLSEDLLRNYSEAKGLLMERLENYLEAFSTSDS